MSAVIEKSPPRSRAGGPGEAAHTDYALSVIMPSPAKLKWKRALELALDAVVKAESGDLGLIARNLVEAATAMLVVASEIQGRLRQ